MKKIILFGSICVLTAACAQPDRQYAREKSVASGQEVRVGVHSNWDSDCNELPAPTVEIVTQPTQGTIAIRSSVEKIRPGRPCEGEEVNGTGVFYMANSDATGTDTFSYRRLRNRPPHNVANITIKIE